MAYYVPVMDYDIKVNNVAVPIGGSATASFQPKYNSIVVKYKTTNYSLRCFKVMNTHTDVDPEWGLHSGLKIFEALSLTQIGAWYEASITVNATNFPKGDGVYKLLLCAQSDLDGTWDVTELLFTLSGVEWVTVDDKNVDLLISEGGIILPEKGDRIIMELGSTAVAGTNNQYRVIQVNGSQAEVMAMYDYAKAPFITSGTDGHYSGCNIDTILNTTFYNQLTAAAKAAIVPQNVVQCLYDLNEEMDPALWDQTTRSVGQTVGQRYIYAPSVDQIVTCLDSLTQINIYNYFGEGRTDEWSAYQSDAYTYDYEGYGGVVYVEFYGFGSYYSLCGEQEVLGVRPVFTIDLTNIPWSKVTD